MSWLLQLIHDFKPYFELLNATSAVLSIFTWLITIPLLIVAWRRSNLIKVRAFGIEATFRQSIEAAAAIGAAAERRAMPSRPSQLARTVETAIASMRRPRLAETSILWVDDNPSNIEYESTALTALGAKVTSVLDTAPALPQLSARRFDLVISDMSRPSGKYAGFALLHAIRERRNEVPVVFYTSSNALENEQEALRRGALGATNDPQELLKLVIGILASA